jgi:DNA ligase (NAD+)
VLFWQKRKAVKNSKQLHYITNCPECDTELIRKEGEANHYCPNEKGCPPQIKGKSGALHSAQSYGH